MSSLAEYVRWYGDFSFRDMEFTEADNLVLCALAYYRYDLKKHGGTASLRRAMTNSFDKNEFLSAVYHSRRFGTIEVTDYTEVLDSSTTTQFAAVTFRLYDNVYYVAFRGTDNTLIGWREDFMISYKVTDGQQRAVKYLENQIADGCLYFVGGHSKGGNLALSGCCYLDEVRLGRVVHIYNNDGPGLCPEVSNIRRIERIRDRVTMIMPTYSIFGRIFDHDIPDTKIVTSSNNGIMEHDILSWEIKDGKLSLAKELDPESRWIESIIDKWVDDVEPEEREKLVRIIFDTFDKDGNATFDSALAGGIDGAEDLFKNMVESDTLKTAAKIPEKMLFGDFWGRLRRGKLAKYIKTGELIEGIVFAVIGVLMLLIPRHAVQIVIIVLLGGVTAFQLVYTFRKLRESRWNFEKERARVYILVTSVVLFIVLLVKRQASFIVGSAVAGGCLLIIAYKSFLAAKSSRTRDFLFYKNAVKAVLYTVGGFYILFAPRELFRWAALILGGVMVVDGLCTVVWSVIRANDAYSAKHRHR